MKKIYYLIAAIGTFSLVFFCMYGKKNRTLLITGCARSGTKYIAKALTVGGLQIGHESMSNDGMSSWPHTVNPKKRKRGVDLDRNRFAHRFHQVRHPLKVISSVYTTENHHSWNYILTYTPEILIQDPHLVKCAKYWYYWNLKAEKEAEWTYCIENIDNLWDEFEKRIGRTIDRSKLQNLPKNINMAGEHKQFTWKELQEALEPELFQNIQHLAQKYGYSTTDEPI